MWSRYEGRNGVTNGNLAYLRKTFNNRRLLTLILLTWTTWWAPTDTSKWRMGFNSAFKGLITRTFVTFQTLHRSVVEVLALLGCYTA
jgi:hypothetical protein